MPAALELQALAAEKGAGLTAFRQGRTAKRRSGNADTAF
jgi:hypothetical protein